MLRVVAALLALIAIVCMMLAIVGMVTGRPDDRVGLWLRVAAVLLFLCAVGANVAAH